MPQLKIIRASAGSGKTFSLTHEYLRLLFAERDNFMHILAVTFTNKATEEMKSRIIRELHFLSSGKESNQLEGLIQSTGLSERQLREKSRLILKRLLHHYSWFSVSTIDSFFQRIIRSFTRELGIQDGYSIELDTDALLTWMIDRLLIEAETDKSLLSWLTRFAESLLEKGESWDLKKGIRDLGSEIFKEEFRSFEVVSMQRFSDRNFLRDYQAELYAMHRNIENEFHGFGQKAAALLESSGLTVEDFSGKSRGPAGFLISLKAGAFRGPTATAVSASSQTDKWHTANSPLKTQIARLAEMELMPLMQHFIRFYETNYIRYFTAGVILRNLYTLGILADLSHLADVWCNENNAFLLSEAPVFLSRIIDANDTPFIYEKAGYWYHHYMIDEFQDTSLLQWQNFKPLISNSLSQGYDNLTVGDAKQSIYRWRNSNWEILENYIQHDFLPGIAASVVLTTNRRSKSEIIHFNNHFFKSAAAVLQKIFEETPGMDFRAGDAGITDISGLYGNVEQEPGTDNNAGGFVKVDYLGGDEEPDYYETVKNRLILLLCQLQDSGYRLSDIAILTRKNREAKQIADSLLTFANEQPGSKYRFDVISDEALRLGSSATVTFLIALLQNLIAPDDRTNSYLLRHLLDTYIAPGEGIDDWDSPEFTKKARVFSLTEIIERYIVHFRLEKHTGERIYLQAFRDLVLEYSRKNNGEISRFLEYWKETGMEKSVAAPAGQDAIRILTIHKSKGLEFNITIIPFCTWELVTHNNSFLWCKPHGKPFDNLELLPLAFTAKLKDTSFAREYFKEFQSQLIDNLNLLYVAFTRTREGLIVMCKSNGNDQVKNVSDLVHSVLGPTDYSRGSLQVQVADKITEKADVQPAQPVSLQAVTVRIRIACQGSLVIDPNLEQPSRPVNEGRILHEIFNRIYFAADAKSAVCRLLLKGLITRQESVNYLQLVTKAIHDPRVSSWFSGSWRILNEAEIIIPGGGLKRPDRVMTRDGKTLIIDYKFGRIVETEHEIQVAEYARLLINMGYKDVEACLWYVRLGRVVGCRL
jgi:ATP-dependent helicase/nuclease subunit A